MPDEGRPSLLCRAGPHLCALPVACVAETLRPLPIEPLHGAPDFVLGVCLLRGAPTPVVDLARLLGGPAPERPGRFVALRVGSRSVALAVDAVEDVRLLGSAAGGELPPLLREAQAERVAAIGRLDAELLLVLEGAALVPEVVWAALAARAAEARP